MIYMCRSIQRLPEYVAHQSRNCLINFRRTNGVNGQSALAFGPFRAVSCDIGKTELSIIRSGGLCTSTYRYFLKRMNDHLCITGSLGDEHSLVHGKFPSLVHGVFPSLVHGNCCVVSFCLAGARDWTKRENLIADSTTTTSTLHDTSAPCEQWAKREGFVADSTTTTSSLHNTTLDYNTFHYATLHSITQHYSYIYNYIHNCNFHSNALHSTTWHCTNDNYSYRCNYSYATWHYTKLDYTTVYTLHDTHYTTTNTTATTLH